MSRSKATIVHAAPQRIASWYTQALLPRNSAVVPQPPINGTTSASTLSPRLHGRCRPQRLRMRTCSAHNPVRYTENAVIIENRVSLPYNDGHTARTGIRNTAGQMPK